MIDHAIGPTTFVFLILIIIVIALILALLIEWTYPAITLDKTDLVPPFSPDTADKWVGMVVVVCGVIYLLSDYANDWMGAICR